jgi:hypothetical protein
MIAAPIRIIAIKEICSRKTNNRTIGITNIANPRILAKKIP